MALRIFVADDHEVVRNVIGALLLSRPGWEVCGEAGDSASAVQKIEEIKPDVVLLDFDLPAKNGLETSREIVEKVPSQKIIMLTAEESQALAGEIFNAGACGLVVKGKATQDLLYAIEAVTQNRTFFTPRLAESILKSRLSVNGKEGQPSPATTSWERERMQRLARELALSLGRKPLGAAAAHPLRNYTIALAVLVAGIACGWVTYVGEWDRVLPRIRKMAVRVGMESAAPAADPGNPQTQVWVDTRTALYYCPGEDLYGKTPRGRFTSQRDAQLDHFEPAARKACQ